MNSIKIKSRSMFAGVVGLTGIALALSSGFSAKAAPEDRQALFGETHVHTALSFDAYIFGNRNDPDAAYRYAKGESIPHPSGFDMQLKTPLDFQAVTDHAMYLGMVPAMYDESTSVSKHPVATKLRNATSGRERRLAFQEMFPYIGGLVEDDLLDMSVVKSAWETVIDAAERHNEPGKFTSFIGYEYTSSQDQFENLHRNVIFRGSDVPDAPFSRLISMNPEDLWKWMDEMRADGKDSLAIPHNSNGSDGFMFRMATFDGSPLDRAYAELRMRNEPIVEVTQVKGTSEVHPLLSPNDEFADFEIMPFQIASWHKSRPEGSYVRNAYMNGLKLQAEGKGNPFKFGLIGASDTHVGAGAFSEDNYWSKIGLVDGTPKLRGSVPLTWSERLGVMYMQVRAWIDSIGADQRMRIGSAPKNPAPGYLQSYWNSWGASGLAGVWAEENTRESIFSAMRRKETFATSGPRLRVRFFAGYDYPDNILERADMVKVAYEQGVPMGSDLRVAATNPEFLVWVMRDPASAPLQRIQVVKGWLENGEAKETIFDVACAGDVAVDPKTNRCPDNNGQVDLSDCSYSADTGADELKAVWRDPEYATGQQAFYYVRALENPTCRWSSWDALREKQPRNPSFKATLQERVWSSPIWLEAAN